MKSSIKYYLALVNLAGVTWLSTAQEVLISHKPEQPIIETMENKSVLNFDFIISNTSKDTLQLTRLEVKFFDKNNQLIQQKFLDNNGTAPSINTIPTHQWNGVSKTLIFNPFEEVYPLTEKLEFTFTFNDKIEVKQIVLPKKYHQSSDFILPLKSKILVYDGHDFYSHHRRFNYEFEPIKELGFDGNFMRYAYDFVVLNNEGKQFEGKSEENSNWFGFSKDVLAVADGEIIAVETNQKDDKNFDVPSLKNNPLALYGNYVVIKHQEGVYSMYGHLLNKSSSALKVGNKIKKGQKIGQIGTSGSSFFPHLHFEIRNSIDHHSEGLPSYFTNYSVFMGSAKKDISKGTVTTGDIIQSK
ncbi:M23 family metallopeptidase [Flavobacterium sp. SM15]|uniref:M23 family metallopeptidase n=1 Tax=Flavobacterium sp. SM15 TaxID=2908005 RepID=UPI001EDB2F75|nr:M23 family metallopeptidase [Flavobacterium sp. SM15]MCG2611148.1 M23 family metallopeptidase [Flavobacterium sp. SM15]